jgi:hypothetical protein
MQIVSQKISINMDHSNQFKNFTQNKNDFTYVTYVTK